MEPAAIDGYQDRVASPASPSITVTALSTEQSGIDCRPRGGIRAGNQSLYGPPFAGRRRGYRWFGFATLLLSVKSIAIGGVSAEGRESVDRRSRPAESAANL